ncbi:zinc finger RNA-binding protein-like isoform X1 [Arapaima gigas]
MPIWWQTVPLRSLPPAAASPSVFLSAEQEVWLHAEPSLSLASYLSLDTTPIPQMHSPVLAMGNMRERRRRGGRSRDSPRTAIRGHVTARGRCSLLYEDVKMAASNYYGFAHGAGTPYSSQPATAYSHPTTASYSVQPSPSVAHAVSASYAPAAAQTARPMGSTPYPGYQIHPGPEYTYGARQPEPAPQPTTAPQTYQDNYSYGRAPSAATYENKPYYQSNPAPATAQRVPTDTYYHTVAKSAYSQPPPQRQVTALKPITPAGPVPPASYSIYPVSTSVQQPPAPSSICSYTPSSSYSSSVTPAYSGVSYSSYDTSGYTPSPSYYQASQQPLAQPPPQPPQPPPQQQPPPKLLTSSSWSNAGSTMATAPTSTPASNAVGGYKKPPFHQNKLPRPKGPPKQPQLHYCDICKISCAGPQTYREHLEGQKHKKKETALRGGSQANTTPRGVQTQLLCELCDVSCTGADAYAAHIRGAKHQKVVKLYNKLGKPIPSTEPVLVNSAPVVTTTTASKSPVSSNNPTAPSVVPSPATAPSKAMPVNSTRALPVIKKPAAPKITFLSNKPPSSTLVAKAPETKPTVTPKSDPQSEEDDGDGPGCPADVQPVGHDYVEEVRNEDGKVIRFHCKLCECSFNDPNAKDMHLKGRRHRLQYKKKVNPELPVDIKPSNRTRKLLEGKLRKQKAALKRQQDEEQRWRLEMSRRYEEDMYWRRVEEEQLYWEEQRRRMAPPPPLMGRPGMPVPPLLLFSPKPLRRPDSSDDRHVMAKHSSIYPAEDELQAVQRIVSHSERALKLVSDSLMEGVADGNGQDKAADPQARTLKGVMRVGILAKGLLLRGDRNVELILLSAKKPTAALLLRIAEQLPKALTTFCEDEYEVQARPQEASVVVCSSKEPKMQVTISLTSPLMREEPGPGKDAQAGDTAAQKGGADLELEPQDILNKTKCLEYLATLRHAKWFQARANGLQSCVIIIRVLRDLCQRVPTWGKMPSWAMELLVEKAISSAPGPLTPGEAMRRVLECMATGILLPDGPGLLDPCEKEHTDVLGSMTVQAREDITASSQHALRLLAFRQIHKVLGMECLPASKARAGSHTRKRRLDGGETGEGDGKKDKKEEDDEEEEADDEDA